MTSDSAGDRVMLLYWFGDTHVCGADEMLLGWMRTAPLPRLELMTTPLATHNLCAVLGTSSCVRDAFNSIACSETK